MTTGVHTVVAHVLNKVMQALWPHSVQNGTLLLVTDNAEYMKKIVGLSVTYLTLIQVMCLAHILVEGPGNNLCPSSK